MANNWSQLMAVPAVVCIGLSSCIFYPNPSMDKRCKEFQSYLNFATAKSQLRGEKAPIAIYYEAYMCGTLYDHHAPPSLEYFLSKPQETVEVLKRKIPQVRDDKEILIVSRVLWDIHKSGGVNVSCDKELLDSWHAVLVRMRSSWLADKSWSCYQATLAAPGPPCGQ